MVQPRNALKKPVVPSKGRTWIRRIGTGAAALMLGTTLSVGAFKALSQKKVAVERERPAIARIYGLNEQKAVDKKVLDFIDNTAKREGISRRRVLETLERNYLDDRQLNALDTRLRTQQSLVERQKLLKIKSILESASQDKQVQQRIIEMKHQNGTLRKVVTNLK